MEIIRWTEVKDAINEDKIALDRKLNKQGRIAA